MTAAAQEEGDTDHLAANGDRDSADIAAILEDADLGDTIRNIRTARKVAPENPARALRLLDLIGTHRPVQGLIDDAARFSARPGAGRDASHILNVAALHRSVTETAGILLAKWPSELALDVARTFARQRPTLDVPKLVRFLKDRPAAEQKAAREIIAAVLDEFAWGDVRPKAAGRPIRDISLVHVRLTAQQCPEEASALLSRVFAVHRPLGFAYDLALDLLHDTPRTDVLGAWAQNAVQDRETQGAALRVMQELVHYCGPGTGRRARLLTDRVGTRWPADLLAKLCVAIEACAERVDDRLVHDCTDKAAAIRRLAASRPDPGFVVGVVKAWWATGELSGTREALLDEVVERPAPAPAPLPVPKLNQLAAWVAEDVGAEVADQIRFRVRLDGCAGPDVAELIGAMQPRNRQRRMPWMAQRLAAGARDRTVSPEAVAEYIRSLRAADWRGSRQAADDAREALTSRAGGDPYVVPRVAVALADRKSPVKNGDADVILVRYLTNHAAVAPADLPGIVEHLAHVPGIAAGYLGDLLRQTVGRWPAVARNAAEAALRSAGLDGWADQIRRP